MFRDLLVWCPISCFDRRGRQGLAGLLLGVALAAWTASPQAASADDRTIIVLATTDTGNERVRVSDGELPEDKPGWFVELSQRAATECGAKADFAFMPWRRALQMVEKGRVQAAFNSSYKAERAAYGVYPLKDGKPDETRASKNLTYLAFVKKGSGKGLLAGEEKLDGLTVAVERQASIIPMLKKRGASVYEVANDLTMLRMTANGRVDAAVAIEDNVGPVLEQNPDLAQRVTAQQRPVQKNVGYVMFSKIFYEDHSALVECFWSQSAQLRDTEWFETMRAAYN